MYSQRDQGKYVTAATSNTVDLPGGITRGICVAVAGDVKVTYNDASSETLVLPAGVHAIRGITRIWVTGTTATGISVIY